MAGRLGHKQVTIKGSRIVNVNLETSQIMVSGPVPGARNTEILIKLLD